MKKSLLIGLAALILCGIGGGVYWWVTRDVRAVRELVGNALSIVRKTPSKLPHAGVLKFTKVNEFFAPKVVISCADPAFKLSLTNEELKTMVSFMSRKIESMAVDSSIVNVEIAGEQAVFSFDAEFSGRISGKNEEFFRVYQVSGEAEKVEGTWKISLLMAESIVK